MTIGNVHVHLYRKFSKRIFYKTTKEIGAEGIALYHHQREIVQTKARSNFTPMFA
jgi:tRNA(Ile)-lysidine synthase TilS/MesJ